MDNVTQYFDLEHSLLALRAQSTSDEEEERVLEEMDTVWFAMSPEERGECNQRARARTEGAT